MGLMAKAKSKTAFVCNECGAEHSKWQGRCGDCNAWNTVVEFRVPVAGGRGGVGLGAASQPLNPAQALHQSEPKALKDIELDEAPRIGTGISELDRVLGGGLVPGSAILVGGNPGAGKSTLLLQALCRLAGEMPALYVTGEESPQQVAMRGRRLKLPADQLRLMSATGVEAVQQAVEQFSPRVLAVDSIQVMRTDELSSAPGSVSQVRECAAWLIQLAKQSGMVLFLVGHVTKDGSVAGPKVLEHMIDCSIMLEDTADSRFRTLRSRKNRFGAVNELGVFAMTGEGLREVRNPSAIFLNRSGEPAAGSAVMVVWEGTRPLLVEIQALVDGSQLGQPRRVAVGLEQNRLNMLLAALHRHAGLRLGDQDVYANVVGGVRVLETGADLALLSAIVSSFRDKALPEDLVIFGEVGLSGEIRPVPSGQERLQEAVKHGFTRAVVPKANLPRRGIKGMEVRGVGKLSEALGALEA